MRKMSSKTIRRWARRWKRWLWRKTHPAAARHEHLLQLNVSKKELSYQLSMLQPNEDLIRCLAGGPEAPDYEIRLFMASLKLQFVGMMAYVEHGECMKKLPPKEYEAVFDTYLDTMEEAESWLRRLGRPDADESSARSLLEKYMAVKRHCIRMLASQREIYNAGEYRRIIDYIVKSGDVPEPVFPSSWSDMPELPPDAEAEPWDWDMFR